eukprot:1076407-Prorocentrum_minimum.AAC.1
MVTETESYYRSHGPRDGVVLLVTWSPQRSRIVFDERTDGRIGGFKFFNSPVPGPPSQVPEFGVVAVGAVRAGGAQREGLSQRPSPPLHHAGLQPDLTMHQSYAGIAGIFSPWTNQTQESRCAGDIGRGSGTYGRVNSRTPGVDSRPQG